MKKCKSQLIPIIFLGITSVSAQENSSPPRYIGPNSNADRNLPFEPDVEIKRLPEEIKQSYDKGKAPFYVKVKSYVRFLNTLYDQNLSDALTNESQTIDVTHAELDDIYLSIQNINNMTEEFASKLLVNECAPFVQGEALSNFEAKQILGRIDSSDNKDIAAELVLTDVKQKHGEGIEQNLRARILEHGKSITFTKISMVDFITNLDGGNVTDYLTSQCNSVR